MFLSSTTKLVELRFVVVPLTVRLPEIVKLTAEASPVSAGAASGATPVKVFEEKLIVLFVKVSEPARVARS